MPKRLTPQTIEDIKRLRAEGLTVLAISQKLHVSKNTVSTYIPPTIRKTLPPVTPEQIAEIKRLRLNDKLTIKKIAAKLGLTMRQVTNHIPCQVSLPPVKSESIFDWISKELSESSRGLVVESSVSTPKAII